MKRIIMSMLLVMAVVGLSFAQEPQTAQPKPGKPQLTEEQKAKMQQQRDLMDIRMQIAKEELKLTNEQFEKFAPVYREYVRNVRFCHVKCDKIDAEKATKKDINDFLKARLDNTINMAMVRKSYILIFEEVITPRQLMKLYRIDDKLMARAREEYKKRQSNQ